MTNKLRINPSRLADASERITRTASWRDDKRTANARGYTYAWQCARKEWLAARPFCVMCQERKRITQATHVDHIVPHCGDMVLFWDRSNWQSLCAHCHSAIKQRTERGNAATPKHGTAGKRVTSVDPCDLTTGVGGVKVPQPVDP